MWPQSIMSFETIRSIVEPPIGDHPKCEDLVVAYGRWSLTRIEPQGASSE